MKHARKIHAFDVFLVPAVMGYYGCGVITHMGGPGVMLARYYKWAFRDIHAARDIAPSFTIEDIASSSLDSLKGIKDGVYPIVGRMSAHEELSKWPHFIKDMIWMNKGIWMVNVDIDTLEEEFLCQVDDPPENPLIPNTGVGNASGPFGTVILNMNLGKMIDWATGQSIRAGSYENSPPSSTPKIIM